MKQYRWISIIAAIALVSGGCGDQQRKPAQPLIIAHRGASHIAPENTVASAVLAFEKKADILEVDVYLSKDSRIVAIHDATTQRTAGIDMKVGDTDAERLRQLDVGTFKSEHYAGEKIPFLEEIIDVVPDGKRLFIEVKCGPEIVPYLKKVIDDSGKADQMEIIAFNFNVLVECKKVMPSIPQYYLRSAKKDEETGQYLPYDDTIIEQTAAAGLTGVNLDYKGLTQACVQKARAAGLSVFVWTVDDINAAREMTALGVDGITTNIPGTMRDALGL